MHHQHELQAAWERGMHRAGRQTYIFSPATALHTPLLKEPQRCGADLYVEFGDRASVARAQAAAHQDDLYLRDNLWEQCDKQGRIRQCSSADQCNRLRPAQETVLAIEHSLIVVLKHTGAMTTQGQGGQCNI